MKLTRRWRTFGVLVFAGLLLSAVIVWAVGGRLVAPANCLVGEPPAALHARNVEFPSTSGATIHGWLVSGEAGKGVVILMHGVHANRRALIARAEWLAQQGYSILLFDFQAHGESAGRYVTFGYLESRDATAAVNFIHQTLPGEKVGVIGISMGAASALLASPPLAVNAMVLESSYPTIYQATEDRMVMRFGWLGKLMTPLLTWQLKPRLGIGPDDLKPQETAKNVSVPKFFISGTVDRDTTIDEVKSLFSAAAKPKEAWWVVGAAHEDMLSFAKAEYEKRVLEFLGRNLR